MSQYTDLVEQISVWTNRPELTAEMNTAIVAAVNKAHRAGHFPRDLVEVTVAVEPVQIQTVDYTAAPFVRYRHLATIGPASYEYNYTVVESLDLFDVDGYARRDIAYVAGSLINIKAAAPVDSLKITYWQRPKVSPIAELNDWIVADHFDLIVLWAAASVLATVGENEIKTRVEALAALHYADLKADSVESAGR